MANLLNDGDINWDGLWQTCGKVDVLHASTNLNVTSAVPRQSGTWNGDNTKTDQGVVLFLNNHASTGTITVTLQENVATVWTDRVSTTITINSSTKLLTYYYFKYSATHTETNGTNNYRINITSSTSSNTGFRVNSVATTVVAIIQVYSATASIAATDVTYIMGITQGATGNPASNTVTMNINDPATAYGAFKIGNGGILSYGTAASTTYYLRVDGSFAVYAGGSFRMGTTGSKIPSDSVATLELNSASSQLSTCFAGSEVTIQGNPFTGNIWRITSTDSIGVVTDRTVGTSVDISVAGWKAGDIISISATGSRNQTEEKIISSVTSSTLTITTDWSNTHLAGAEICNLTRNVILKRGGAGQNRITIEHASTINIDYSMFDNFYSTSNNIGTITLSGTGIVTSESIDYCSFYKCGSGGSGSVFLRFDNNFVTSFSNAMFFGSLYYGNKLIGINTYNCIFDSISVALHGNGIFLFLSRGVPSYHVNCNYYDSATQAAGKLWGGVSSAETVGHYFKFINCKFWAFGSGALSLGNAIGVAAYNCIFGGDGTNTVSNGAADILVAATVTTYLINCKYLTTTAISLIDTTAFTNILDYKIGGIRAQHINQVVNRFKTWQYNGQIADQITGGYSAAYARSGSGICVTLNPNSTLYSLRYSLMVPVTAATGFTTKFYITKSTSGFNGAVSVNVYDSHDDTTLLLNTDVIANGSIPLNDGAGDDWTYQYTTGSLVPTNTGFCRIEIVVLDGSTTGDIFIDDVSVI